MYAWCLLKRLGRLNSEEPLTLPSLSCPGAELLRATQVMAMPDKTLSPQGKCQCPAHWCVSTDCHSGAQALHECCLRDVFNKEEKPAAEPGMKLFALD